MNTILSAVSLISSNPSIAQLLYFSAIGFGVVMLVLLFQTFVTAAIGKIFVRFQKNADTSKK